MDYKFSPSYIIIKIFSGINVKFLFFFLPAFLIHCYQFVPQPINVSSEGNGSNAELVRISICQDADELSSCANLSASTPSDLASCFGEFSKTLSDTLDEIEPSETAFSLTDEELKDFESTETKYVDCTNEISTKIEAGYVDSEEKLQELHEDMLSCTEGFITSFKKTMKCN